MFKVSLGALVLIFAVSGCGGEESPIPPEMQAIFDEQVDAELVVRARSNVMEYIDTRIEAPEGSRVRIVMDNTETSSPAMIHNVVVINDAASVDRVALAAQTAPGNIPEDSAIFNYTPQAQPGTMTAVVFTMPPAGEYPYICTYPGHFQSMRGVLVSTPAP
ncbi:MAG: plastocyanin/azurin family copper-binding protein [Rubricoccaceae bacterium]|nr:plastocyanin/azurin family copper-binding protein [Rubricoccaceae bacterium]